MNWIRDVVLVSAILGFLQWILPSGTYEKYMKHVFSMVTLAVILSPLAKDTIMPVGMELPQEAIAAGSDFQWEETAKKMEAFQEFQMEEVLKENIQREVYLILNDEFPGISEEDIEIYIEQKSMEPGFRQCRIVIAADKNQSYGIQTCLENHLDLSGVMISIVQKKAGGNANESHVQWRGHQ